MKIRRTITKILILMVAMILGVGVTQSFATSGTKNLQLSYLRYVYNTDEYVSTYGYALNTVGAEGESHHPVYQILSVDESNAKTGTNYYCLNAKAGTTWNNATVGTSVPYNQYYDLDDESALSELAKLNNTYSNIVNSSYKKQILWILNNMYIPDSSATTEENLTQKNELLGSAGIVYKPVIETDSNGNEIETSNKTYKYEAQTGYDYTNLLKDANIPKQGLQGYYYSDKDGNFVSVSMSDELVEVTQQAAIWYYTNYLDNNVAGSETYNAKNGLELVWSYGATSTNTENWDPLESYKVDTDVSENQANVGQYQQEMATILYNYLVDAANNYASSTESESTGAPVEVSSSTVTINTKKVSSKSYYVAGPIKINETRASVYNLDKILINNASDTGAYISDENGNSTSETLSDVIGKEFYISIPTSEVSGNSITIDFTGTYKTNEKLLWAATGDEQPVVEVTKKDKEMDLTVSGSLNKEFDLALQKYISSITSNGTTKVGRTAPTINSEKLANREATTATYRQDKTPVQVKYGDYVTYTFTVYNEGDIDGYVNKITDNIPSGLQFVYQDETSSSTTENEYVLMTVDSEGNSKSITVDKNTYDLVEKNSYWAIDKSSTSGIKTDTYNGETTTSISCDVKEYLGGTNILLNAYDSSKDSAYDGSGLSSTTVTVVFRVSASDGSETTIRNEAAITEAVDKDGNVQDKDTLTDRDSQTDQWPGKDDNKDNPESKDQDDEDYDNIILGKVDLALTKFIAAVSSDATIEDGEYLTADGKIGSKTNPYTRATEVNTTPLKNGGHDAIYTQVKTPLEVEEQAYVLYDIRVYNEGDVDVYAGEITDYLPDYLSFVGGTETASDKYGWSSSDGTTIKTSYLAYNDGKNTDNLLKAFDKETENAELDYRDLQILCRVKADTPANKHLVNTAAITKYEDENGNNIEKDVDSEPTDDVGKYEEKSFHQDGEIENHQDDDDFDVIYVKERKVDLALTKFIAAVSTDETINNGEYLTSNGNIGSNSNPYTRATSVDTTELRDNSSCHDATYTQIKTPLEIEKRSYVLYDIRVYNEGSEDVYAGEVTDYLPDYLDYVPCEFNSNLGWTVATDGKTVSTTYLGYNDGKNTDNLLKAFDKMTDDGKGSGLDYRDLQILCKLNSKAPTGQKLINTAAITKYEDNNGNELSKDVDSDPNDIPDSDKNQEKRTQDDDDWEVVKIKEKTVDIALTKFIAAVSTNVSIDNGEYLTSNGNIGSNSNPYTRATSVDTTELRDNSSCHDATYTQVKTPLEVEEKSYVLYDIRVYNEGEEDVYAGEVTDYLPNYLDYVSCEFNDNYGWTVAADGKTVSTTYLGYNDGKNTDNLLKAFDKKTDDGKGSGLDYRDLQILCKVNSEAPAEQKLVNTAAITKYEDDEGTEIDKDVDSDPGDIPNSDKNQEKRTQDDDDWEVIKVKEKIVDLALTKFIAAVSTDTSIDNGEYLTSDGNVGSDTNPYTRATSVDTTELRDNSSCHDATYIQVKDPLTVPAQSYVLYDIRVYNEGEKDVYAGEVTDYLPNYLDYVSCEFNDNYEWTVAADGKTISTTYLGYNDGENTDNLLSAFDKKTDDGKGSGLDYRDLQILCKINDEAPTNQHLVNTAAVTKYEDEDGDELDKDVDSDPSEIPDSDRNQENRTQDDDDYDVIVVKTFDLSLLKYVSTVYVTEDGNTKTTETGNTGNDNTDIIPKVEINRKKVDSTVVKFGYTIKITNEGDIAGYAKEITDYVPEGLQFYAEDNNGWTDEGNNVISTRLLENTLLQPGESAEVTVIFRWINGSNNLGLKTNIAEISEDYNEDGIPDRDSDPDNRVNGEDDIDDAQVILSISTGLSDNIVMYITIGTICLAVLATGIISIKKFVL